MYIHVYIYKFAYIFDYELYVCCLFQLSCGGKLYDVGCKKEWNWYGAVELDQMYPPKLVWNYVLKWLIVIRARDLLDVDTDDFKLFIDETGAEGIVYCKPEHKRLIYQEEFKWLMKYFLWSFYDDSLVICLLII